MRWGVRGPLVWGGRVYFFLVILGGGGGGVTPKNPTPTQEKVILGLGFFGFFWVF